MEDWQFLSAKQVQTSINSSYWRAGDGAMISNEEYDEWLKHKRIPDDIELKTSESGIINIESNLPHTISEVICVGCTKRWIATRPTSTKLKDMECPGCGWIGGVIETGQRLEDTEYEA